MQYNDAYDQVRIFGADELNPVEIESTFSKNNLRKLLAQEIQLS